MSYEIGKKAEEYAKEYLSQKGYTILACNYCIRGGEIDIIALQKYSNEDTIVFVEVKYRSTDDYGLGREYVTLSKQKRIIKTAEHYLYQNGQYENTACRFDIIEFQGSFTCLEHIENAFYISI